MKHSVGLFALTALVICATGLPASAWIINLDTEQWVDPQQNTFEMVLAGHVLASGGRNAATNAFPSPNRQDFTAPGYGSAWPFINATGFRFIGTNKDAIAVSPGVKRHFGIFEEGPRVPTLYEAYWTMDKVTPGAVVPVVTVAFAPLGNGNVQVTVSNATGNDVQVSDVGYKVLRINSFGIQHLNRGLLPPSAFTPSGVASGTVLAAYGGNAQFIVSIAGPGNPEGYDNDIVVYVGAQFTEGTGITAPPTGLWVAWNSGTYVPAKKAYLGRVYIKAANPTARNSDPEIAFFDLAEKTPFDVIVPVIGPAARFLSCFRSLYDPGWCVPNGANPSGPGCNPAFGNAAKINANLCDLVLSTTDPGGMKLSYLRTAAQDWYRDVRVKARIMPGASTTTTTVAASDDFGGPIAIRVQPTGGSYFASVVTGRKNRIDLMRDSVNGATQTSLAGATQWANGDAIALDHNVPASVPVPNTPPLYVPKLYDIVLQAVGANLTLTVTEVGNTAHTVTLTATDSTYAAGYVGLRTQRDGSADYSSDANGDKSITFEAMVRDFRIENPAITPAIRVANLASMRIDLDNPDESGGILADQRAASAVNDHEIAQLLIEQGFAVDDIESSVEVDSFSYVGAYADFTDPQGRFAPPLNGNYDMVWCSGGGASAATKFAVPRLTMPFVFMENGDASWRRCDNASPIPAPPGDVCGGTNADAGTGLSGDKSGDLREGGGSTWCSNCGPSTLSLRILSAAEGGNPDHPLVAGLTDGTGTKELPVYAEMFWHMQSAGFNTAPGASYLGIGRKAGGPDGVVNGHPSWGLVAADVGGARAWNSSVTPHAPNQTFPARNVFLWVGDFCFHRMTAAGREIARRAAYWSLNLPIPTSPFMYYGDFDGDGDADLVDFGHFQGCFNGPNRPYSFEKDCADADFDGDGDVDLLDFSIFQGCFNGPNRPPNAGCPTPPISIPQPR